MVSREPHYLRFARSLALATTMALPACSDADAPVAADDAGAAIEHADSGARADANEAPARDAAPSPTPVVEATDAAADGHAGKISGPLPPPELPAAFA